VAFTRNYLGSRLKMDAHRSSLRPCGVNEFWFSCLAAAHRAGELPDPMLDFVESLRTKTASSMRRLRKQPTTSSAGESFRQALLGRGDKRNPQSEKDSGDTEPYRSPQTKLRGTRWRFATASPHEEEPLGAALNPPVPWCPNDTKCRPGQSDATGDEEHSAD
jgi:hypothetical protein